MSDEDPSIEAGQVWRFYCEDYRWEDYFLLLRPLDDDILEGTWEVFDLINGVITFALPCIAGDWELMSDEMPYFTLVMEDP